MTPEISPLPLYYLSVFLHTVDQDSITVKDSLRLVIKFSLLYLIPQVRIDKLKRFPGSALLLIHGRM